MKCSDCKDKGLTLPERSALQRVGEEGFEDYARRMGRLARESYCHCLLGQRLLWMSGKVRQRMKKFESEGK